MENLAPTILLVVDKGPREGEILECKTTRPTRIGRVVKGNTLAIKDPGISQKHLVVELLPDLSRWAVSDLDTSNGTLVNGKPIPPSAPYHLSHGDTIKIGETTSISVQISTLEPPVVPLDVDERVPRTRLRRGRAAADSKKEEVPNPPPEAGKRVGRGGGRRKKAAVVDEGVELKKDEILDPVVEEEENLKSVVEEDEALKPMKNVRRGRGRGRGRVATARVTRSRVLEDEEPLDPASPAVSEAPGVVEEVNSGMAAGVGEVEQRAEEVCDDWEKMTLREWFERMETFLPRVINDVADEIIVDLREKAARFDEYIAECSNGKII